MELAFLQKNYSVVLLLAILAIVMTFTLNLILPQTDQYKSYVKTVLISIVVSSIVVYIHIYENNITEVINLDPVPF